MDSWELASLRAAQCLIFHLWQSLSWVVLSDATPRATPLLSKPVQLANTLLASAVKSFLLPEFPAPAWESCLLDHWAVGTQWFYKCSGLGQLFSIALFIFLLSRVLWMYLPGCFCSYFHKVWDRRWGRVKLPLTPLEVMEFPLSILSATVTSSIFAHIVAGQFMGLCLIAGAYSAGHFKKAHMTSSGTPSWKWLFLHNISTIVSFFLEMGFLRFIYALVVQKLLT